jgi:hypothetical protein
VNSLALQRIGNVRRADKISFRMTRNTFFEDLDP